MRGMMSLILQITAVTLLNLGNMRFRIGPSLVAIVGFAGVVLVFVGVLSIRDGFDATLKANGAEDVAVVLRGGANSELTSGLSHEQTRLIAEAPGVAMDDAGPLASSELLVIVDVPKRSTGGDANVPVRGVGERAFTVRENVHIVAGRDFEAGRNEVIVGRQAAKEFDGLAVGNTVQWGRLEWQIVGHFSANGGLNESEIWTDARVLQDAYNRGNTYQVVYARLRSADSFPMFRDALDRDPRLNVNAQRETDYLAEQAQVMSVFISAAGMTIAILMGIGAVFGAINTMYTTVAARASEIATLRALGFGRFPVLVSVIVEGVVLGLIGGLIGAVLAWFLFNGFQASTLNFHSFSQVAFTFSVTPQLMMNGLLGALFMGVIGGLMPGIRAARMPVARALREL